MHHKYCVSENGFKDVKEKGNKEGLKKWSEGFPFLFIWTGNQNVLLISHVDYPVSNKPFALLPSLPGPFVWLYMCHEHRPMLT